MNEVRLTPVSVKLINSIDNVLDVWNITRPHQKLSLTDNDIKKMGLPVNGFASYSLEITASLLFRDLLFTLRPINPWAISNRAVPFDHDNLSISEDELNLLPVEYHQDIKDQLYNTIESVISGSELQDYAKNNLPRLTSTTICVNLSLRSILNYVFTLYVHYKDYYNLIGKKILTAIGVSDDQFNNWKKSDLYGKLALSKSEINLNGHNYLGGEMHSLFIEGTGNLVSQFIRQHNSTVKCGLYNELSEDPILAMTKTQNDLVKAGSYLDEDSLDNLIKTRSCFFAMMDKESTNSWSSIIGDYVSKMTPSEFFSKLPCHGCKDKCEVESDMKTRAYRLDCNIPCPILLENPDPIEERIEKFGSNSRIMNKWEECERLITVNFDNEYNKAYYGEESK